MKEYIVTGGTGFLGRNLIRRLIEDDNKIYAIVRPGSRNLDLLPKSSNVIPILCELKDVSKHGKELPSECDSLFHFAWGGVNREELNDDSVQQINVDNSVELLKYSIDIGCKKFVFAGSRSEYGIQKRHYSENLECQPIVAYGRAKLKFGELASQICMDSSCVFLHPRIFSVYGPDDHPWSLVYTAIGKMLRNEQLDLSECRHYWNYMYVRDAVDLILTISRDFYKIPKDDNCIFNVATRDIRPLREYVEEIKEITGSKSILNYGAYVQSAESAVSLLPDMDKVEKIFGWKPDVSFTEGINVIIRKMEEHNA